MSERYFDFFEIHIIIIIIIIIIRYRLYAVYLQLYILSRSCYQGVQCCGCSAVTSQGTCNVISHVEFLCTFRVCVQCPVWLFWVVSWVNASTTTTTTTTNTWNNTHITDLIPYHLKKKTHL
jgi:hypothetical protein